jgi:hypothetical protein
MDITEPQATHAEHAKRVADRRKWCAVYDGTDTSAAAPRRPAARRPHPA